MKTIPNSTLTKYCKDSFLDILKTDGYVVLENVVSAGLIARLKLDLQKAIETEALNHSGKNYQGYGMVLVCPLYGQSFLDLLEVESFLKPVEDLMGETSILYSYTSSSMPPLGTNYSNRIHNDSSFKISEDYFTRFGVLLALDDFTEENGATYVLPGSHKFDEAPSEEYFYDTAKRVTMKAGSAWYANPKVWHAGGSNTTDYWRHGVALAFCRPYMKQRLDIPKMMETTDLTELTERAKQKLGFFAQVPQSYSEYYSEPNLRKFRQALE